MRCDLVASVFFMLGVAWAPAAQSADDDPQGKFWMAPSWLALEEYAQYLKDRPPAVPEQGPWPRDEALERMKAHLALGIHGPRPQPYADWVALKRKAALAECRRELATGIGNQLQYQLGLGDVMGDDQGAPLAINLVQALELPVIRPSLFRSEAHIAPPGISAVQASGRFGIVVRQVVTARPGPDTGAASTAGLYDMLARTEMLVRPVQRVQLFRDGRLHATANRLRRTETLWRAVNEPMCEDWAPGFAYGHADASASMWRSAEFGDSEESGNGAAGVRLNGNPAGSLFAFYTTIALPKPVALRSTTALKLERKAHWFVSGVFQHYDLDHDGIADLTVWEGRGRAAVHMGGIGTIDESWYRLALININGAWKVLGSDAFRYGCGC